MSFCGAQETATDHVRNRIASRSQRNIYFFGSSKSRGTACSREFLTSSETQTAHLLLSAIADAHALQHHPSNKLAGRRSMAPRFVARQLSRPAGLGGTVIQFLMNRGNDRLNRFAVNQLLIEPGDRVLEIGFGGGVALPSLLSRARFVCGIDRSDDVVGSARRRFSSNVEAGTADFRIGSVEALPLAEGGFEKALTVNTVYFWTSLEAGMQEICRVLSPGGRVVIGFVPKVRMDRMNMPSDIFTPRTPEDIAGALRRARFTNVEIRAPGGQGRAMAATGLAGD
jgi:arsenite methyltransferase